MTFKGRQVIRTVHRLARLLAGRNRLRRPYDRIEGTVLLVLAAFLAAMAEASLAATWSYQSQRAADAGLHRATAIVIQGAPDSRLAPSWEILARWPALAIITAGGAALGLLICYGLCRIALDKRRLAGWESAWASTGPRWTSRDHGGRDGRQQ